MKAQTAVDCGFRSKLDAWSCRDAALLLCGFDPDQVKGSGIRLDGRETPSEFLEASRVYRMSNQMTLPALTVSVLYKRRWQVELFFKWVTRHLRIKRFFGTSENTVKTQVWIALSVYVLVAIIKKRLKLEAPLYTLLLILSVTLFEKTPLQQAFPASGSIPPAGMPHNQLNLFTI